LATATNRAGAWRILSRGLSSTRSNSSGGGSTRQPPGSINDEDATPKRKKAGKLPDDASVAVLGGGLTGLTTAYYLAKWLPSTTKITLLEGSDRLGGWIRTDRVPVKVGGVEGVVNFERGPRSFSSLNKSTWRFDDLVLWDLVRLRLADL
jgi:oxygen-dependent protoporphyrinogen oxidase